MIKGNKGVCMVMNQLPELFGLCQSCIAEWDDDVEYCPPVSHAMTRLVMAIHKYNYQIWHQEDIARKEYVNSENIARVKRNIDGFNQKRNDSIEKVDEWLLANYFHVNEYSDLPMRTETPGSVFDKLSILALKVFHMREQTERTDVEESHILACTSKLNILLQQQQDLQDALISMINDLISGKIRMKMYLQFKMYNDPSLNPELYNNSIK